MEPLCHVPGHKAVRVMRDLIQVQRILHYSYFSGRGQPNSQGAPAKTTQPGAVNPQRPSPSGRSALGNSSGQPNVGQQSEQKPQQAAPNNPGVQPTRNVSPQPAGQPKSTVKPVQLQPGQV